MGLISLIIILTLIGFLLWILETHIPVDPAMKVIIRAVVLIVVVLWLISLFLGFADLPIPRLHR